jgi:hypothetical protein
VLYLTEINRQLREYERPLKLTELVGACVQFRPLPMLIQVAILGITPAAFAFRPLPDSFGMPELYYLAKGVRRTAATDSGGT